MARDAPARGGDVGLEARQRWSGLAVEVVAARVPQLRRQPRALVAEPRHGALRLEQVAQQLRRLRPRRLAAPLLRGVRRLFLAQKALECIHLQRQETRCWRPRRRRFRRGGGHVPVHVVARHGNGKLARLPRRLRSRLQSRERARRRRRRRNARCAARGGQRRTGRRSRRAGRWTQRRALRGHAERGRARGQRRRARAASQRRWTRRAVPCLRVQRAAARARLVERGQRDVVARGPRRVAAVRAVYVVRRLCVVGVRAPFLGARGCGGGAVPPRELPEAVDHGAVARRGRHVERGQARDPGRVAVAAGVEQEGAQLLVALAARRVERGVAVGRHDRRVPAVREEQGDDAAVAVAAGGDEGRVALWRDPIDVCADVQQRLDLLGAATLGRGPEE
mmetsp:Transcript_19723/g.67714  ORF Transcript_19723/g.67714 Transcript_19723/m.67714 type:complete len:393 (-) Transcript_19723:103-1281(-)